MKFVIDNAIPDLKERLEAVGEVIALPAKEITRSVVADADALIVRTRTRCNAFLLEGSSVSLVATATAGTDHIDSQWCRSAGIDVVSAPGCNAPAVAQYVLASLHHSGYDPSRHVLGVVGKGHVGSIVTDWARRLGGKVCVCDPPRQEAGMDDDEYLSLPVMLRSCDYITFHVPLTVHGPHATRHMLDAEALEAANPHMVFINAARGGIIDEKALLQIMQKSDKSRFRLIIDTWETEPQPDSHLLEQAIIATPHIAGYSLEGKQRATRMVIEAVEQRFGLTVCKDGLATAYTSPHNVSMDIICRSYDPMADTERLRANPADFEYLRNHYCYRNEPQF